MAIGDRLPGIGRWDPQTDSRNYPRRSAGSDPRQSAGKISRSGNACRQFGKGLSLFRRAKLRTNNQLRWIFCVRHPGNPIVCRAAWRAAGSGARSAASAPWNFSDQIKLNDGETRAAQVPSADQPVGHGLRCAPSHTPFLFLIGALPPPRRRTSLQISTMQPMPYLAIQPLRLASPSLAAWCFRSLPTNSAS